MHSSDGIPVEWVWKCSCDKKYSRLILIYRKYFSDQESGFSSDYVNKKVLEALVKVGDSFAVKIEDEKAEDAVETLSTKVIITYH